jgi:FkbM family methyltransferase
MLKKLIQSIFNSLGYQVSKLSSIPEIYIEKSNAFTMLDAIKRCQQRGTQVSSVIDISASNGQWSELCMQAYPNAFYHLIEAQEPHKPALEKFKTNHKNVEFTITAAGRHVGEIYFDNTGLFSGLASETPLAQNCIKVPVTTIDEEIRKHKLQAPFLIKLDTHGFEVPILEGAAETLKFTNIVIIEAYNFQLRDTALYFFEMCEYMRNIGFLPIDIVDLMDRKKDNALWQMDIFFIPKYSSEFQYNGYE